MKKNGRKNFLKTPQWREMYRKIIERDGERCRQCGGTEKLTVQHIRDESNHKPDNLITLCWICRKAKHNRKISTGVAGG